MKTVQIRKTCTVKRVGKHVTVTTRVSNGKTAKSTSKTIRLR